MQGSNSMSNHPIFLDVDTLTSQILLIFSLFVDNVEISIPENFSPQLLTVPKLLRFENLAEMVFQGKIRHFEFTFSVITNVLVIPSS